MSWEKLSALIEKQDPVFFVEKMQGVPLADVHQCEANCAIQLPKSYEKFLLTMGTSSGDFHPFGPTMVHDFYALMKHLPAKHYPQHHFFKVAFESDESEITKYHIFIDLRRSSGDDAPLVMFEAGVLSNPDEIQELGLTFNELITSRIYNYFELNRKSATGSILIDPPDLRETSIPGLKGSLELLRKMGYTLVFPELPRVACLRRDGLSVLLEVQEDTRSVLVKLGANAARDLATVVQQFLEHMPGASQMT